ncbi:hypothetical protein TNCV_2311901 [Trichonephila clavipes]|nr:hypothetical protein TNCV_2311901 [Trichonephila clavipes]
MELEAFLHTISKCIYLGLEVERPGLRGSFLISGLEGARGCGYGDCFGDIGCDYSNLPNRFKPGLYWKANLYIHEIRHILFQPPLGRLRLTIRSSVLLSPIVAIEQVYAQELTIGSMIVS